MYIAAKQSRDHTHTPFLLELTARIDQGSETWRDTHVRRVHEIVLSVCKEYTQNHKGHTGLHGIQAVTMQKPDALKKMETKQEVRSPFCERWLIIPTTSLQ